MGMSKYEFSNTHNVEHFFLEMILYTRFHIFADDERHFEFA